MEKFEWTPEELKTLIKFKKYQLEQLGYEEDKKHKRCDCAEHHNTDVYKTFKNHPESSNIDENPLKTENDIDDESLKAAGGGMKCWICAYGPYPCFIPFAANTECPNCIYCLRSNTTMQAPADACGLQ